MIQIKGNMLMILNWLNFKDGVINRGAKNRT